MGTSGRPSRRGVGRNNGRRVSNCSSRRRPSRRGVGRNVGRSVIGPLPVVAPRAGAWVETAITSTMETRLSWSPLAQGRGSKHLSRQRHPGTDDRRPSRRGVGRNAASAPPRPAPGRPSRRGVGRNYRQQARAQAQGTSPLAQGRGSKLEASRPCPSSSSRPSRRGVGRNMETNLSAVRTRADA